MIDLTREQPMSVKQVMADFDVSRRTVENWFGQGLEKFRIGRRVYTTRQAIQRFAKHDLETMIDPDDAEIDRRLDEMGVK